MWGLVGAASLTDDFLDIFLDPRKFQFAEHVFLETVAIESIAGSTPSYA